MISFGLRFDEILDSYVKSVATEVEERFKLTDLLIEVDYLE